MSWYKPEDAKKPVIPAGEYEASIVSAQHKTSKSGNHMCEVVFKVYTFKGEIALTDYLMPTAEMTWKIKSFAKALGAEQVFEAGDFDPVNYTNKMMRLLLEVKDDPKYGEQNRIKKYINVNEGTGPAAPTANATSVPTGVRRTAPATTAASSSLEADDIPF